MTYCYYQGKPTVAVACLLLVLLYLAGLFVNPQQPEIASKKKDNKRANQKRERASSTSSSNLSLFSLCSPLHSGRVISLAGAVLGIVL
jgi:hypothetical protein